MKKILIGLVCCTILAVVYSFTGVNSVSAAPASPDKGNGCYVTGDGSNYFFDENCSAHQVLKLDDAGENVVFYEYQDHGQLPDGVPHPSRTLRNSFELCLNSSFGPLCGTVHEIVTPSGEYKSSFNSY